MFCTIFRILKRREPSLKQVSFHLKDSGMRIQIDHVIILIEKPIFEQREGLWSISLLILKWEQNSGFNLELIVEGFHLNVCNSLIWYQCHIPQKPLLLSRLLLGTIMLTACFIAIRSVSCENCRKGSSCLFDILLGPTWFPLLTLRNSWCSDISQISMKEKQFAPNVKVILILL